MLKARSRHQNKVELGALNQNQSPSSIGFIELIPFTFKEIDWQKHITYDSQHKQDTWLEPSQDLDGLIEGWDIGIDWLSRFRGRLFNQI